MTRTKGNSTNGNKQLKQDKEKKTKEAQSDGSDTESDRSSSPTPQPKVHPGTHWPLDCTLELLVNYEAVKEVRAVKTEFYPLVYHVTRTDYQNIAKAVCKMQSVMEHIKPRLEKQKRNSSPTPQKAESDISKDIKSPPPVEESNNRIMDLTSAKLQILKLLARIDLKKQEFSKLLAWMTKLELRGGNRLTGQLYIFDASDEKKDKDSPKSPPSAGKSSDRNTKSVQNSSDAQPITEPPKTRSSHSNTQTSSNKTNTPTLKTIMAGRGRSSKKPAEPKSNPRRGRPTLGMTRGTRGRGRGRGRGNSKRGSVVKSDSSTESCESSDNESDTTSASETGQSDVKSKVKTRSASTVETRLKKRIGSNTESFCPNKRFRQGKKNTSDIEMPILSPVVTKTKPMPVSTSSPCKSIQTSLYAPTIVTGMLRNTCTKSASDINPKPSAVVEPPFPLGPILPSQMPFSGNPGATIPTTLHRGPIPTVVENLLKTLAPSRCTAPSKIPTVCPPISAQSSATPGPVPLCLYRVEDSNPSESNNSWLPAPKVEIDNAEEELEYSQCFQRKDNVSSNVELNRNNNSVDSSSVLSSTSQTEFPPSPIIKTTCTGAVCGGDDCQYEHIIHMDDSDSEDDTAPDCIKKEPFDDVTIIDDHKEADPIIIIDDI